jgi:hypothetical protein
MSETISGGAYMRGDQWVNANGEPLDKGAQAEAEKLQSERSDLLATQERELVELTAMRDPVARALMQQQAIARAGQPQAEKASK